MRYGRVAEYTDVEKLLIDQLVDLGWEHLTGSVDGPGVTYRESLAQGGDSARAPGTASGDRAAGGPTLVGREQVDGAQLDLFGRPGRSTGHASPDQSRIS